MSCLDLLNLVRGAEAIEGMHERHPAAQRGDVRGEREVQGLTFIYSYLHLLSCISVYLYTFTYIYYRLFMFSHESNEFLHVLSLKRKGASLRWVRIYAKIDIHGRKHEIRIGA